MGRNTGQMVLREQKTGRGSGVEVNVVSNTPRISTSRPGQAPRASGKVAQDGQVSPCPTTSDAGPELPGFPVEFSDQLVWFQPFSCIKVVVEIRSSSSESKTRSGGWPNWGS